VFGILIDKITTYQGEPVLSYLSLPITAGITLWITIELFYRLAGFLQARAFPKLEADIRMSLFEYVQDHSYSYFANQFAGNISNKISDMTLSLTRLLQQVIQIFVPVAIGVVLSTALFIWVSPVFGLILGTWITIHMGISLYFAKACDHAACVHSESRSVLMGRIVDSLSNHINVRLFSRRRYESEYMKKYQDDEKKKNIESLWIIEKMKVFLGIASFIGVGLLLNGYMLYAWANGEINAGQVVFIFNAAWNVTMMVWFAGLEMPLFFKEIGTCRQALTLIQTPHDIVDKPNAKPLKVEKGIITFENVSFKYSPQNSIFKDKSITIKAGEKVGLVGFSGSGKTTFVHLILRYYDIHGGRILIDGQDIRNVTLDSLRDNISLIPQDPSLFHRSIWENIRYGKPNASPEEIIGAAKRAHAEEFILKMPEKFQSLVGERGVKLSGGQKQRIAIARAILKDAPILILDEATSALDSVTEKAIQDALQE
ncbi:MAG: ABC transporter ATP-binding protein, partial [Parachlamydiaceae bacterium]